MSNPPNALPAERPAPRFEPYLPLMVVTTIIWGAAFPISRPGLADMPPATFALCRFAIAALILTPMMFARRGGFHIARHDWSWVIAAGLLGFTFIQLAQNWGLKLSTASDISMLAASEPVTIALLAIFFLKEKHTPFLWLGLGLCLVGALIVIGANPLEFISIISQGGDSGNRLSGDLIFLVGTTGFAGYNIIARHISSRLDGLEFLNGAILAGIAGLVPFSLAELASGQVVRLSTPLVLALLYTSLLVTVFGFLALSWSLKRVPASRVAILFYLQPVAGVLVAQLYGEKLSVTFLLGAALIFTGVFIAQRLGIKTLT